MKKLLVPLIISLIFSFTILGAFTFFTRLQTSEEIEKYRKVSDSIALNVSGQGVSSPFIPESETKDGKFIFLTYSTIKYDDSSCMLYVSIYETEDHKHLTVRYPCQIQDNIIYSIGFDYANVSTFSLIEYIILGGIVFLISFSIIAVVKVAKG